MSNKKNRHNADSLEVATMENTNEQVPEVITEAHTDAAASIIDALAANKRQRRAIREAAKELKRQREAQKVEDAKLAATLADALAPVADKRAALAKRGNELREAMRAWKSDARRFCSDECDLILPGSGAVVLAEDFGLTPSED